MPLIRTLRNEYERPTHFWRKELNTVFLQVNATSSSDLGYHEQQVYQLWQFCCGVNYVFVHKVTGSNVWSKVAFVCLDVKCTTQCISWAGITRCTEYYFWGKVFHETRMDEDNVECNSPSIAHYMQSFSKIKTVFNLMVVLSFPHTHQFTHSCQLETNSSIKQPTCNRFFSYC